jgi:hypothetical protein
MSDLKAYLSLREREELLLAQISKTDALIARLKHDCEQHVRKLEQEKEALGYDIDEVHRDVKNLEEKAKATADQ